MASQIIINPAKNTSNLLKTDGTLVSLKENNKEKNPFDKIPLTKTDTNKIEKVEENPFDKIPLTKTNNIKIVEENPFDKISIDTDKDIIRGSIIEDTIKEGHERVKKEANGYFTQKAKELKKFAVGDKAEWDKYWEIALGRSVLNLGMQYHFDKELWGATDWETAFGPELEDTGFVEKLFLQGASIVADLPTLAIGGLLGRYLGVPGASAYGAGFLTESLRTTYLKALQEGDVNSFSEWWNIYIDEGIKAGHQAGVTLGLTFGLPKVLQLDELLAIGALTRGQHYVANVLTQYATFQGAGYYYNGEFPNAEQLAIDGILFSVGGIAQSGKQAINKAAIKEKKSAKTIYDEKKQQQKDAEILYSKNQDSFVRTNEGQVSGKPLEYVSVPLLKEKLQKNIKFIKTKVEFPTSGQRAAEKTRLQEVVKLDEQLIQLEKKINAGSISERQGRIEYSKISTRYERLAKEKADALSVEKTSITIDKTKSKEHQDAEQFIQQRIVRELNEPVLSRKEKIGVYLKQFGINWWDKLHPVLKGQEAVVAKGIDAVLSPYEMARVLSAINQMADSFVYKGIPLTIEGTKRTKSYIDIIKQLDTVGEVNSVTNLLYSRRIIELYERKVKGLYKISKEEYNASKIIVNEASNKIVKTANEIVAYEKQMLKWMRDNKYIDKQMYDVLLEAGKDYIPFLRESDSPFINPMYKIKGSDKRVIDPIVTIATNTSRMAAKIYRNNLLKEFFEPFLNDPVLAQSKGIKFIKEKGGKVVTVPRSEIARVLGLSKDKISGFKLDEINYQFFAAEYNFQKNNVIFYKDAKGKQRVVEVEKDLYDALSGINSLKQNSIFNNTVFQVPTTIAKNTITLSVPFFIRNIIRDTKVAAIVSKNPNYIPVYQMIRGIFLSYGKKPFTFKKDPQMLLEEYIARGGFDSHFFKMQKYSDPKVQKLLAVEDAYGQLRGRDIFGRKSNKQSPLSFFQAFAIKVFETSEIAAKLAEFELTISNLKKNRSKGKNKMTDAEIMDRALYEAKNLMDFSKAGLKAEVYNQQAMFFNARIRGLDKIGEAYKRDKYGTFAKSVKWTSTPYLFLWLLNNIDDTATAAYDLLPQWRKDTGYNIPIGNGEFIYIAGEWEHFQFYGGQLGAFLDTLKKKEPEIMKQFYFDAAKTFLNVNVSGFMPDYLRMTLLEQGANYDNFYQKPVVNKVHVGKLPQHQYTPQTSFVGKELGKIIKYSPIKIDKAISSLFNSYGRTANRFIDYAAEKFGYKEIIISPFDSRWIGAFENNPFTKAFLVKNDTFNVKPIEELWRVFKKGEKTAKSVDFLLKGNEKMQKEGKELMLSYDYLVYEASQKFTKNLSGVYNLVKSIADAPNSEYPKLKNETNREYENRILAEKNQTIGPLIQSMIEATQFQLKTLKQLKKISKELQD
jgi:hypothetical protein